MSPRSAVAGRVFGRLTPQEPAGKDPQGRMVWKCACACGNEKRVRARHLVSGQVVSCGCHARSLGSVNGKASAHKLRGSLSHLYKPNLSAQDREDRRNLVEVRQWRRSVFERDQYTCAVCGVRGREMNAHHLNSWAEFPEQRFDVANGVTLCRPHHKEFHDHMGGERRPCTADDYTAWYVQREIEKRERAGG